MNDWADYAACKNWAWPDEFFSPRGAGTKQLRSLCNTCPVNIECLDWAMRHEAYGYWAGTDEDTRHQLRKQHNILLEPVGVPLPDKRPRDFGHGTPAGRKSHQRRGETPCDACLEADREDGRRRRALKKQQNRETA